MPGKVVERKDQGTPVQEGHRVAGPRIALVRRSREEREYQVERARDRGT